MTWSVPANAGAGVTSPGALARRAALRRHRTGTVAAGGGVVADAECSTTPSDPVWRRDRSVLAEDPTADHLDVLVDRDDVTFTPVTDPDGDGCDADTHAYRLTLRPRSTDAVNLRVDDPVPGDNSGALTVSVARVRPMVGTETVAVDTSKPAVATTPELPGRPAAADHRDRDLDVRPREQGRRRVLVDDRRPDLADHPVDDAASTAATSVTSPSTARSRTGRRPAGACDAATHTYYLTYTPRETGPLTLGVADLDLADNLGTVTVSIGPASEHRPDERAGPARAARRRGRCSASRWSVVGCSSGDTTDDDRHLTPDHRAARRGPDQRRRSRPAPERGPVRRRGPGRVGQPDPALSGQPLPTVPPGDPGDDTSEPEATETERPARGPCPPTPCSTPPTVGAVAGGTWTASAAPQGWCATPRTPGSAASGLSCSTSAERPPGAVGLGTTPTSDAAVRAVATRDRPAGRLRLHPRPGPATGRGLGAADRHRCRRGRADRRGPRVGGRRAWCSSPPARRRRGRHWDALADLALGSVVRRRRARLPLSHLRRRVG